MGNGDVPSVRVPYPWNGRTNVVLVLTIYTLHLRVSLISVCI